MDPSLLCSPRLLDGMRAQTRSTWPETSYILSVRAAFLDFLLRCNLCFPSPLQTLTISANQIVIAMQLFESSKQFVTHFFKARFLTLGARLVDSNMERIDYALTLPFLAPLGPSRLSSKSQFPFRYSSLSIIGQFDIPRDPLRI